MMEISELGPAGLHLAAFKGRLDTETAPAIERQLLDLLSRSRVVLDMTAVRFVTSAGLRVLLKAAKTAKSAGSGFAIYGLQPAVREVYAISGFDRIVIPHGSRDEAVAALS